MMHSLGPARERFDAVLFDLDGTLLDRDSRVTARTHRAVRTLVDAGFTVMLCTGRSVAGSLSVYRGLGLDTPLAAYNGNWIGHPGRKPWRVSAIGEAWLGDIERTESAAHFFFRHEGHRKYTVPGGHHEHERVARWYENVVRVRLPSRLPRRGLMRVSCFFGGEADTRAAWARMGEAARDELALQEYPLRIFPDFADTDLYLGEIQPRTGGKAQAFEWLETERGIPASRTIAVGDQKNDLTMLAGAGLPVVVANGVDEARRLARLVIGHHAEEGIATWVERGMPDTPTGAGYPHAARGG